MAAGAAGLIALLLTAAVSQGIVRPLEVLTSAVRQTERGNLQQRVKVHSTDEVGELGRGTTFTFTVPVEGEHDHLPGVSARS